MSIFTVGGTVQAGGGIYIERAADGELLELCRAGEFAYILHARQMGKSSLVAHTAERLTDEGVRPVIIDLTLIGTQVSPDQWYFGLLETIVDQLDLEFDILSWWHERDHLGVTQRLAAFVQEVLLQQVSERIVIFVDEIDTTLSLRFTDDFYAAIRALYNARAQQSELRRVGVVLIGVATPGDLIKDPQRTPFNIGKQVTLSDFTPDEVQPFAAGLLLPPEQADAVLGRVLHWTEGHPYLTQRLCAAIAADEKQEWNSAAVDRLVQDTFLGERSKQDNNLQFVRDMLTRRAPDTAAVLTTYRAIRRGKAVRDEERSLVKNHLKLSGAVKRGGEQLVVRNNIYAEAFNERWVKENIPNYWMRQIFKTILIAVGAFLALAAFLAAFLVGSYLQSNKVTRANATLQANSIQLETAVADLKQQKRSINIEGVVLKAESMFHAGGDPTLSVLLTIEAANQVINNKVYDNNHRIKQTLAKLVQQSVVRVVLQEHTDKITNAIWSKDGETIITSSQDKTARLWDSHSGRTLKIFRGHKGAITSVSWSPDTKYILTTSKDETARLWDTDSGLLQATLEGHTDEIINGIWSPDGKYILTLSTDKTTRIWSLHTNKTILKLTHPLTIMEAIWSPNSRYILTNSNNAAIQIWDMESGSLTFTLEGHTAPVTSISWSSDSKKILSSSQDSTIRIWDAQTGQILVVLQTDTSIVWSAKWSPDERYILTASDDKSARIWDALSGQLIITLQGHTDRVINGLWSPNGQQVLTVSSDNIIRIWDAQFGNINNTLLSKMDSIYNVIWSPDGNQLLVTFDSNKAQVWDITNGQIQNVYQDNKISSNSISWSADLKKILIPSIDGTVSIWNTELDKIDKKLKTPDIDSTNPFTDSVTNTAWSPDERKVFAVSADGNIRIWSVDSSKLYLSFKGHAKRVTSGFWSPDGTYILTISDDRTARVWDVLLGKMKFTLSGHDASITSGKWSPDGTSIATGSNDGIIRFWNAINGQNIAVIRVQTLPTSIEWSPKGDKILVILSDGTAQVWDAHSFKLVLVLQGHAKPIINAAWSKDGLRILTASADNTARLWNSFNGSLQITFQGHTGPIYNAIWSPDHQQILTTSADGSARLWDAADGKLRMILPNHTAPVTGAAFSPDGKRVLTASADGTVRIWVIDLEDLVALARSRVSKINGVPRTLTPEERRLYGVDALEGTPEAATATATPVR